MKKYLVKTEIILPYLAAATGFLVATEHLDITIYFVLALLFSFYFFPVRLFIDSLDKAWFRIATSVLFANILVLLGIYFLNPELSVIATALDVASILCVVLLVYKYVFEQLSVRNFILLVGFNILAVSRIVV